MVLFQLKLLDST